jgi:hypothetical protein
MPLGSLAAERIFAGFVIAGGPAMGIDIEPYDIVGFAGAAVFVIAYFANQQRWLSSEDWRYPFANLVGAVLILVSLMFEWNYPSVVIEVFWALISLYGIAKSRRERAAH